MFDFLNDAVKITVGVGLKTPIALAKDIVTLGGTLNDRNESYTLEALEEVENNINNITKPR